MAKMGEVPVTSVMPFVEEVYFGNVPLTLANNTSADIELGRFTMPFTGRLSFAMEWTMWFSNYQQITVQDVGFTSPAPSIAPVLTNLDGTPFNYLIVNARMSWPSVAAGALVIVNMRFTAGGGGSAVNGDQRGIWFRAVRA